MDRRDALTWITIELTYLGEARVEDGTLEKTLRQDLQVGPNFPVFVPSKTYKKGNKPITLHLVEGYAFVGSGLPDTAYFALEKRPYVSQVMSSFSGPHRLRAVNTISNRHIKELQKQLRTLVCSDIASNSPVHVVDGTYRGLEGKVLCIRDEHAYVQIELRSIHLIATIPLAFLEVCV